MAEAKLQYRQKRWTSKFVERYSIGQSFQTFSLPIYLMEWPFKISHPSLITFTIHIPFTSNYQKPISKHTRDMPNPILPIYHVCLRLIYQYASIHPSLPHSKIRKEKKEKYAINPDVKSESFISQNGIRKRLSSVVNKVFQKNSDSDMLNWFTVSFRILFLDWMAVIRILMGPFRRNVVVQCRNSSTVWEMKLSDFTSGLIAYFSFFFFSNFRMG